MSFAGCKGDEAFGPIVQGCRADSDFTMKFEKIFLSIVPVSIFHVVSLLRIYLLARRPIIIKGLLLQFSKSVSALASLDALSTKQRSTYAITSQRLT